MSEKHQIPKPKHQTNPNIDELVKSRNSIEFVIPAKAGIQLFQDVLNPGAGPGPDPGFAGVTTQETFYETINIQSPNFETLIPAGLGHWILDFFLPV